ncbi:MAG TPA: hypothetical protein VFO45_07480 [Sphingomicrobium sp.]|nr:hypothetical protein [Sphingomicrobium sp.]
MGNNKRNVQITAKPKAGDPGEYEFSMDEGNGKTTILTFDKTKDGMKKTDDYEIKFKLKNEDGADLKFSRDLNKVLWAEPTTVVDPPCPTSQQMQGIFYVKSQGDIKDDELTVTNTDPKVERFIFAFNFLPSNEVDGPTANYKLYDPIGDNLDGGFTSKPPSGTSAFLTIGGAVLGGLATLLAMESATTMNLVVGAVIGAILGFAVGKFL